MVAVRLLVVGVDNDGVDGVMVVVVAVVVVIVVVVVNVERNET